MYDAWRSFFFGILDGVISLLGVVFFLYSGIPWLLSLTLFGIVLAWNFVPIEQRRIKFIDKVPNAVNGTTLFGWSLTILVGGTLFVL